MSRCCRILSRGSLIEDYKCFEGNNSSFLMVPKLIGRKIITCCNVYVNSVFSPHYIDPNELNTGLVNTAVSLLRRTDMTSRYSLDRRLGRPIGVLEVVMEAKVSSPARGQRSA